MKLGHKLILAPVITAVVVLATGPARFGAPGPVRRSGDGPLQCRSEPYPDPGERARSSRADACRHLPRDDHHRFVRRCQDGGLRKDLATRSAGMKTTLGTLSAQAGIDATVRHRHRIGQPPDSTTTSSAATRRWTWRPWIPTPVSRPCRAPMKPTASWPRPWRRHGPHEGHLRCSRKRRGGADDTQPLAADAAVAGGGRRGGGAVLAGPAQGGPGPRTGLGIRARDCRRQPVRDRANGSQGRIGRVADGTGCHADVAGTHREPGAQHHRQHQHGERTDRHGQP